MIIPEQMENVEGVDIRSVLCMYAMLLAAHIVAGLVSITTCYILREDPGAEEINNQDACGHEAAATWGLVDLNPFKGRNLSTGEGWHS